MIYRNILKLIILLILLGLIINLFSTDYIEMSWNKPQICSKISLSLNHDRINENQIISKRMSNETQSKFVFHSKSMFLKSLRQYFSKSEKGNFIEYASKEKEAYLKLNLQTGYEFVDNTLGNSYNFLHFGLKFHGLLGKNICFYGDWWKGHIGKDLNYAIENSQVIDSWFQYDDERTVIYLDNFKGKLLYKGKHGNLAIGNGKFKIGNNIGGSIILNDACNDYGYFSSSYDLDKLQISFIHNSILPDSLSESHPKFIDKYLVIHKIDWLPNKKFHLFLGEEVVYGNRSMDVNYLLPFSFYRIIEHNISDRDNVLIFSGINYYSQNKAYYLNLIFDEFSKNKIFTSWWGNKYAAQVGFAYKFNFDFIERIVGEFTAIRPWIYTHKFMESKFSNNKISLGFPDGSNLIQFALEANFEVGKNITIDVFGSYTKQGSTGNDFSINYEDRKSDNATWLDGDIEKIYKGILVMNWQPIQFHLFKIGVQETLIDDYENKDSKLEFFFNYYTYF